MPSITVPPYATWLWTTAEPIDDDKPPRRCCFDEAATAVARMLPVLEPLKHCDGTLPKTLEFTATKSSTRSGACGRRLLAALDAWLRGASQVVVINNPLAGILIVASLFFPSPVVGVYGVLGLSAATTAAALLRFDAQAIASGLFGYNGLLVGMAFATFLVRGASGWSLPVLVASAVVAALSSVVNLALGNALVPTFSVPPFTLAFNLCLQLVLLASAHWSTLRMPHHDVRLEEEAALAPSVHLDEQTLAFGALLHAALVSVGQVFLCESAVSGAWVE